METVTLLFIAVGLAMDAFAVSISCGLAMRRREHVHALRIAGAFGVFQAGMPLLGWCGGLGLRSFIEGFDHWVALGLLGYIGGKMIAEALWSKGDPRLHPPDNWTLLALAVATSIDAMAVGLTLSVLKWAILLPVAVIGAVTFGISYLGIVMGYEFETLLRGRGRQAVQVIGGLILISIGVKIFLSHI